ncbi:GerAB/ArcD/ProY family transporter [Pelotomaculum propionicicum]|uniref:GerAB/ArcD/ProY family transporter n=1 Tax=Pelotomaculum propionicicum TaxID=258475 RepID=UPI003B7CA287
MEPGKISERQLVFLITTVLITTVVFWMPQLGARAVAQDVWLTALIASLWGILSVLVIIALARRYPGLTIIEYLPLILGKPLGKFFGALYAFWFLSIGAVIIFEFAHFLNITIMPRTPLAVFMVTVMALCFYALRSGLEVWARVNEILLPVVVLAMLAVIVLPFGNMDLRRLLPIADHPLGLLISTSANSASWHGEVILAGMFIPALASFRSTSRSLIISVVTIGFILAAVEIASVAAFGGLLTGQKEFPFFSLARMIGIARVFERLEVLIVMALLLGTSFKICAFLYCSTLSAAQVFGFRSFQFLLLPVSVLMLAFAQNFFKGIPELTDFLTNVWPGYALLSFELVIPLFLYLIAIFHPLRQVKES